MAYSENSDYSEDFEDEQSSKGARDSSKHLEVVSTPKRAPVSYYNKTNPAGQRKARSHYNPSVGRVKNWSMGKGRALSEKPLKRGTPFSPRDRELSAKVHAIKKLQNKLSDCQRELGDMKRENKLLNRLQVRQERELTRVQTQEGELPQILARHTEEVRVLKEQLKRSTESTQMHQDKESSLCEEIQKLKTRSKKLEQVAKRKNLLERESLTLQLQEAKEKIQEKDRKIKELEKGIETLNKTHGQEIKALLVKNRTLSLDLETAVERTQKLHAQLKDRMKEMDVMNIYSQRLGRNTLNTSMRSQIDTPPPPLSTDDAYSQTDLTCPPNKNVSMQTKPTLKSSGSQTAPSKALQTRTTQTDIAPVDRTRVPSPPTKSSPAHTIQRQPTPPPPLKQKEVISSPAQPTKQLVRSPPPPEPSHIVDEEQQRKNLLLSRLRALDSQKGPPASQPLTTVPVKTTTESQSSQPTATASQTTDERAITRSPPVAITKSPPVAQMTTQQEEAKKKKLLLAKLMAIDDGADPQKVTESKLNVASNPAPQPTKDLSAHSSNSLQLWQADTVDNLHKGKPAFFTDDDPFGSRHSSGKRSNGTLKANSGTKTSTVNDTTNILNSELGYKPTFGRRARGADPGPASSLFSGGTKDTNPVSSSVSKGTPNRSPIFSNGLDSDSKETVGLLDSEASSKPAGRDYPWEKRVNLHDNNQQQGPGNQNMVFGPMAKAPLLPLRPKAEANRVDILPGGLAEPDDLEELVL